MKHLTPQYLMSVAIYFILIAVMMAALVGVGGGAAYLFYLMFGPIGFLYLVILYAVWIILAMAVSAANAEARDD